MGKTLFHVYAGTQGTAGLYLNEIIQAISDTKIKQKAFVSYYYPFNNAKKVFYHFTDLASGKHPLRFRPYLRYLELILGLLYVFIRALFLRPKYLNYSLNSSYLPEFFFLIILKKCLKIKIIITCHDVIPFENSHLDTMKENDRRSYLLKMSDFLLVHNDNSQKDLIKYYGINPLKILYHPFPVMDLNFLGVSNNKKTVDFLFIGHLRCEKGVTVLLDSWREFHKIYPEATLYVVGNNPPNSGIIVDDYKDLNIKFILNYVDDITYTQYIASAKCVVLPYLRGTNSGIPSSVYSMGTDLIVSDIPMFRNNPLINEDAFFECGNSKSLVKSLQLHYTFYQPQDFSHSINTYKAAFKNQVSELYTSLFEK